MIKEKIFEGIKTLRDLCLIFSGFYIWVGVSHYLYYNINEISGNALFYSGFLTLIFTILISPKIKQKVFK